MRDLYVADLELGSPGFIERVTRPLAVALGIATYESADREGIVAGYQETARRLESDFSAAHNLLSALR